MNRDLRLVVFVLVLFCGGVAVFSFRGQQAELSAVLTPDLDSEKLLYDDVFMNEALQTYTLRSLTASLSRLGYAGGIDCHNRAHELGRRAYEIFGGESFKGCGIECHSGCRHGATEAFFAANGTSDLIDSLHTLCGDELENRFHMHQCIHGIGHGLMAWYDYALHDVLAACDLIQQQYHQKSCYSGVFMENIVGSIVQDEQAEDSAHYTQYLSDDPHYPCNAVQEKYRHECYWLQTDRMHQLLGDFDAVGVACAEAPESFRFACFHSMGRTVSGQVLLDPAQSREVCMRIAYVPGRNWCLEGTLNNLFWDPSQASGAVAFCALSLESSFEEICYDRLMTQATEVVSKDALSDFCQTLPTRYQSECMGRETPKAVSLSVADVAQDATPQKVENAVIRYRGGVYVPNSVHIAVGQKVVWINEDAEEAFWPASNIHPTHAGYPGSDIKKCGTAQQEHIFDACEELPYGAEYSFVFDTPGRWRYHDHINPQATGVVLVSE